eukprot:GHVU01024846.1.p1 GENE.GHVU01024846.1~~GHVU01024846.1.p1  ORF type:complete len:590 (+),score=100.34 GHVU01024846.1:132-1772(+)
MDAKAHFARRVLQGRTEMKSEEDAATFWKGLREILFQSPSDITKIKDETIKDSLSLDDSDEFWVEAVMPAVTLMLEETYWLGSRGKHALRVMRCVAGEGDFIEKIAQYVVERKVGPDVASKLLEKLLSDPYQDAEDIVRLWKRNDSIPTLVAAIRQPHVESPTFVLKWLDGFFGMPDATDGARANGNGGDEQPLSLEACSQRVFNRHSNDKEIISEIRTLPTADEVASKTAAFLLGRKDPVVSVRQLLEKQYRWLREDFVDPLRTLVRLLKPNSQPPKDWGERKTQKRLIASSFKRVEVTGVGGSALAVTFDHPLRDRLQDAGGRGGKGGKSGGGADPKTMKEYDGYWKEQGKKLAKDSVVSFLHRDGRLLRLGIVAQGNSSFKPIPTTTWGRCTVTVRFPNAAELKEALLQRGEQTLAGGEPQMTMVQLPVPFFAYEYPLVRLANMSSLPLQESFLNSKASDADKPAWPQELLDKVALVLQYSKEKKNIAPLLPGCIRSIVLDESQAEALRVAFDHGIAMIQGPPGTGRQVGCSAPQPSSRPASQ